MSGPPYDRSSVIEDDDAVEDYWSDRRAAYYADEPDDAEWDEARRSAGRRQAAIDRRHRRNRRIAVLAVIAVIILPLFLMAGWFYFQVEPRGGPGPTVTVTIEQGWGTGDVANALSAAGVIDSTTAFKIWASITGAGPFVPGKYTMQTNLGARGAVNALKTGPPIVPANDLTLLLPPGLTLNQIADRIGQLPGRNRDRFLQVVSSGAVRSKYMPAGVNSAEGFLFPDTYRIGENEDEASIARKLVARFDEIADRAGLANSTATNGLTPYQTVVAASLIQTETKLAEDAPLISAVIRNRLRDGMQLQIDSTLCYAKGGCPPVPTNADKAIDSPYNTYKIPGLPPTPIASVTEANLLAAINPANVPYKYYVVSDASGKHAFATTLAEHNANVAAARAKGLL
jgi:UPF0755 protein